MVLQFGSESMNFLSVLKTYIHSLTLLVLHLVFLACTSCWAYNSLKTAFLLFGPKEYYVAVTFYGLYVLNKGFLFASQSSVQLVNPSEWEDEWSISFTSPMEKIRPVYFYQRVQGNLEISVGIESKPSISLTPAKKRMWKSRNCFRAGCYWNIMW